MQTLSLSHCTNVSFFFFFIKRHPSVCLVCIRGRNDDVHPHWSLSCRRNENDSRVAGQSATETVVKNTGHKNPTSHPWNKRALSAKVTYHSPHSFWLTIFLWPFRCSIRTNSIASEAAQSIRQTVDSAGRASISHGVTQSTRGDLRSTTVPAEAMQANWRHYFRMPLNHKVHRKKNAFMHLSCSKQIN